MRKSARFQFPPINARVEEYWTRTNSHIPNCLMTLINIKTKPKNKNKKTTNNKTKQTCTYDDCCRIGFKQSTAFLLIN